MEFPVTTPHPPYDVVAIGNAIVDVLSHAEDSLLESRGLPKGSMTLIDAATAHDLYTVIGPAIEASGGSAGNTVAGIASLGGRVAYIGKVADDTLGAIFRHDIRAVGVSYEVPPLPASEAIPTARCIVLITPDAERTMSTYLGACTTLVPEDIDETLVASGAVTYVEGYLWDKPTSKAAILKASTAAKAAGRKFSLSLSDTFCVERHRDEFQGLARDHIDILFANESEALALYQSPDLDHAVAALQRTVPLSVITRGAHGTLVVTKDAVTQVSLDHTPTVVDTTGAGDLFAAGFLYGYTKGYDLTTAARLGNLAAGDCIGHVGPRPERPLSALAAALLA